jgi:hypothetical protein
MSESGDYDLSGRWTGFYNYSYDREPTGFEVEIRDSDGLLTGETTEEGDTPDCYGMTLHAVIEGRRIGTAVTFNKHYDYLERADYVVVYEGSIQADGDEIYGVWTVPGVHSGPFLMVRRSGRGQAVERKADEKAPV